MHFPRQGPLGPLAVPPWPKMAGPASLLSSVIGFAGVIIQVGGDEDNYCALCKRMKTGKSSTAELTKEGPKIARPKTGGRGTNSLYLSISPRKTNSGAKLTHASSPLLTRNSPLAGEAKLDFALRWHWTKAIVIRRLLGRPRVRMMMYPLLLELRWRLCSRRFLILRGQKSPLLRSVRERIFDYCVCSPSLLYFSCVCPLAQIKPN